MLRETSMQPSKPLLTVAKKLASNCRAAMALHFVYIFWSIVILYAGFIIYKSNFGMIDDWWLPDTILVGKKLPLWVIPQIGRFVVLPGQEYNLLSIISDKPRFFYTFNAIELICTAWLLVQTGKWGQKSKTSTIPYIVTLLIMITPGFTDVWFRLFIPERSEMILLLIFIQCYQQYLSTEDKKYLVIGAISASLALLCKETAFILVGGFGVAGIVIGSRNKVRDVKCFVFDIAIILLSLLWVIIYYLIVYRFRGAHLYGAQSDGYAFLVFKEILFSVIHDPVIIIGGCVLSYCRIFIMRCNLESESLMDIMLISSLGLIVAYAVLGMSSNWHLLPLYIFIPYIVSQVASNETLMRPFRYRLSIVLWGLIAGQLLMGVSEVSICKYSPNNFQLMLSQLLSAISESKHKANIYLAGVDRGSGVELYLSLNAWLPYKGVSISSYDLRSDIRVVDKISFDQVMSRVPYKPFSYQSYGNIDKISKGAYVILTPYDTLSRRSEFEDASKYRLYYKTNSITYSIVSVKSIVRMTGLADKHGNGLDKVDPNYYIYIAL